MLPWSIVLLTSVSTFLLEPSRSLTFMPPKGYVKCPVTGQFVDPLLIWPTGKPEGKAPRDNTPGPKHKLNGQGAPEEAQLAVLPVQSPSQTMVVPQVSPQAPKGASKSKSILLAARLQVLVFCFSVCQESLVIGHPPYRGCCGHWPRRPSRASHPYHELHCRC